MNRDPNHSKLQVEIEGLEALEEALPPICVLHWIKKHATFDYCPQWCLTWRPVRHCKGFSENVWTIPIPIPAALNSSIDSQSFKTDLNHEAPHIQRFRGCRTFEILVRQRFRTIFKSSGSSGTGVGKKQAKQSPCDAEEFILLVGPRRRRRRRCHPPSSYCSFCTSSLAINRPGAN